MDGPAKGGSSTHGHNDHGVPTEKGSLTRGCVRVRSIIIILLNCNIFVVLLLVTMPAFLSGFCIGSISNFV